MKKWIILNHRDNVATAVYEIKENTILYIEEINKEIKIKQRIPPGHKFSSEDIPKNKEILKYGEVIGKATQEIKEGEHVHTHNVMDTREDLYKNIK